MALPVSDLRRVFVVRLGSDDYFSDRKTDSCLCHVPKHGHFGKSGLTLTPRSVGLNLPPDKKSINEKLRSLMRGSEIALMRISSNIVNNNNISLNKQTSSTSPPSTCPLRTSTATCHPSPSIGVTSNNEDSNTITISITSSGSGSVPSSSSSSLGPVAVIHLHRRLRKLPRSHHEVKVFLQPHRSLLTNRNLLQRKRRKKLRKQILKYLNILFTQSPVRVLLRSTSRKRFSPTVLMTTLMKRKATLIFVQSSRFHLHASRTN